MTVQLSLPLVIASIICLAAVFTMFGIFLERMKVEEQNVRIELERTRARRAVVETNKTRICGKHVWRDHKTDTEHVCVLKKDHSDLYCRAANGMGRLNKKLDNLFPLAA